MQMYHFVLVRRRTLVSSDRSDPRGLIVVVSWQYSTTSSVHKLQLLTATQKHRSPIKSLAALVQGKTQGLFEIKYTPRIHSCFYNTRTIVPACGVSHAFSTMKILNIFNADMSSCLNDSVSQLPTIPKDEPLESSSDRQRQIFKYVT